MARLKKLTPEEIKELLAKEELDTYYGGLCDALWLTKAQIRQRIEIMDKNEHLQRVEQD